ncbi:hypothetical protein G7046_g9424 [Stylonectria norvegica]|nr:hypothetical protein G7046_g9424 [Stylonectria norvegica]
MGKTNRRAGHKVSNRTDSKSSPLTPTTQPEPTTTTAVAADPVLGYKIRVLLFDFLNVKKNPDSERRINSTTDEHYISAPYFDERQAAVIKAAVVDVHLSCANGGYDDEAEMDEQGFRSAAAGLESRNFDAALRDLMRTFVEKRRASGDARPCGPHHLAPMYAMLFGIKLDEVQESKILGRLRKSGV